MKILRKILGKSLRRYYIPGRFYRIPFGPNKGAHVEYDPSMNLDMMLGLHEPNTFEVARQIITDGMLVWDVGANRGSAGADLCYVPGG